jgi:hypothetical protein
MSISMDYSALFPSSTATATNDLLAALYGKTKSTLGSASPLKALQTAEANQTKDIATTAKQPQVARDIAAFNAAVASAKDPATLLKNPTVMKVLLTANGLGDQVAYTALAQKALLSNGNTTTSLVNQLSDTRWKTVVQTYDFANKGLSVLQNPKVLSTIANGYAEITWRKSLDATTPGLSSALTFRAQAATVTSALQILGDSVLRDVVTTALNIPKQIAFQPIGTQEKAITGRLDISKLKDPHFVATLTQEYLLNKASGDSTTSTSPSLDALAVQAGGLVV